MYLVRAALHLSEAEGKDRLGKRMDGQRAGQGRAKKGKGLRIYLTLTLTLGME